VLRTDDLARVAGARGSTPRPRSATLAREERRGRGAVRLRIGARQAARLPRRSLGARVTVLGRRKGGGTVIVTQAVRIERRRR
jgi:hypothetical protein